MSSSATGKTRLRTGGEESSATNTRVMAMFVDVSKDVYMRSRNLLVYLILFV